MSEFVFTPENLLENIHKLGAWSTYGLASSALQHYFPDEYDDNGSCATSREVMLLNKLGLNHWEDVIIKYHTEVGYKSFDPLYVNER